jgi:hypothetical protein
MVIVMVNAVVFAASAVTVAVPPLPTTATTLPSCRCRHCYSAAKTKALDDDDIDDDRQGIVVVVVVVIAASAATVAFTVPVTFAEAALGTKVRVPTPLGEPVSIKVPAGTPSGKVMRVKGRGVETGKATGDLLVTIEVVVPTELSDDERTAVEALAAAANGSPRKHLGVES